MYASLEVFLFNILFSRFRALKYRFIVKIFDFVNSMSLLCKHYYRLDEKYCQETFKEGTYKCEKLLQFFCLSAGIIGGFLRDYGKGSELLKHPTGIFRVISLRALLSNVIIKSEKCEKRSTLSKLYGTRL